MPDINNKIAYIIAVVNEFSTRFSLNPQQAYRYLDVVDDLAQYCHKNGGALI